MSGRVQHYRFPNQKARFISEAMAYLREYQLEGLSGVPLRDSLLNINGIGPKTAGWITRNYADSDDVAILDVHLVRAGLLCGIFSPKDRVEKDYHAMETRFIKFCNALGVRPAVLDCIIWDQMRALGGIAIEALRGALSTPTIGMVKLGKIEAQQFRLF